MRSSILLATTVLLVAVVVVVSALHDGSDDHYKPTDSCNAKCASNTDCHGYVCSRCQLPSGSSGNSPADGGDDDHGDHEGGGDHGGDERKRRYVFDNNGGGDDDDKPGHCTRGHKCGESCAQDLDCDQLSTCSSCIGSVCAAANPPCGTICYSNNDCTNSKCTKCEWPGVCVPGAACNAHCNRDADCNRLGLCGMCEDHQCVAACGKTCTTDAQCTSACPSCTGGVCSTSSTPPPPPPPPPMPTPTPPPTPCDNDYLEVTVRVPKSAACKQCKNGGCRA